MTTFGLALLSGNSVAQPADMDGVKAASKAFYAALPVLDNGEAMEKVWGHTNYVTYVGPRSKSIIVGWEAQKKYWVDTNKLFSQREATLSDQHIHVTGNLAWEMGQEFRGHENEGRCRGQDRLHRDKCLREIGRSVANRFPSCAAETAITAN